MTELKTEQFTYNGEEIFQVKEDFVPGSLICYFIMNGLKTNLSVTELGENYINISTPNVIIPDRAPISLTYRVETDTSKFSTLERLKMLEKENLEQRKQLATLAEALKYRVDIQTFKTYLKSLEKKIGVDLIDQTFSNPYP